MMLYYIQLSIAGIIVKTCLCSVTMYVCRNDLQQLLPNKLVDMLASSPLILAEQ